MHSFVFFGISMKKTSNTAVYTTPKIMLLKPLKNAAGEQIKTLSLRMISHAEHSKIIEQYPDDNDRLYRALIQLGTGLTDSELGQLLYPDYNTLLELVDEHYGQPSTYWFDKAGVEQDDSIKLLALLHPLADVKSIDLVFPTLAMIDVMNKQDESDRDMFIKMSCTGLGAETLEQLSVSDWKMLDRKVNDFLSQTGSFFSSKMIEKS